MIMGKHKTKVDNKEKDRRKQERKSGQVVDENAAKHIQEMEIRLKDLTEQSAKVEARMRTVELERRRCELIRTEISKYPEEGVNFYKPAGRMFLLSTKSTIMGDMTKMIDDKANEIPRLKLTHAQFELKMKSEAQSLGELVGVDNLKAMFGGMNLAAGTEAAPSSSGGAAKGTGKPS